MRTFIQLVVLFTLLCTPGCVSSAAREAIADGIAGNAGAANDTTKDAEYRELGLANYDLLQSVRYNVEGTPMSPDSAARIEARKRGEVPPFPSKPLTKDGS